MVENKFSYKTYSFIIGILESLHLKKIPDRKRLKYESIRTVFQEDMKEIRELALNVSGLSYVECDHYVYVLHNYINIEIDNNLPYPTYPFYPVSTTEIYRTLLHMLSPRYYHLWKQYGLRSDLCYNPNLARGIIRFINKYELIPSKEIQEFYISTGLLELDDSFTQYLIHQKPWLI